MQPRWGGKVRYIEEVKLRAIGGATEECHGIFTMSALSEAFGQGADYRPSRSVSQLEKFPTIPRRGADSGIFNRRERKEGRRSCEIPSPDGARRGTFEILLKWIPADLCAESARRR